MNTAENVRVLMTVMMAIQSVGIVIPMIGIFGVLQRRQTKTSTKLLIANIGVLIMNSGYLIILRSNNLSSSISAFKIMYLGNIIFYLFFILFCLSYLQHVAPVWFSLVFVFFEIADLYITWNDATAYLTYFNFQTHQIADMNINYLTYEYGPLSMIRYTIILLVLIVLLSISIKRMLYSKTLFDKHNYIKLSGSLFVVTFALMASCTYEFEIYIVPISSAVACIFIIVGVLKGDFYSIVETGRDTIFDAIESAIVMVDSKWNYIDANMYAKNRIKVLNYLNTYSNIPPTIRDILDNIEPTIEFEGNMYSKNAYNLYAGKEVVGQAIILSDITSEAKLMEQLVDEKEKAQSANIAKSLFMSNMSHEIRTPMNAIVGMSEILMRTDMEPEYKQYVENIRNSGDALLSIINDILDFSKIESGKLELVEDEYEPTSLLNDLSMIFLNRIGTKPIDLIYDIDPRLPAKLFGDVVRIRQIITNIVNNAIKFTDEGCVKITIKIRNIDNSRMELMVAVRDTGMGIKESDLGKLFQSFSQVDTKKNHEKEGTGLGLAISKQLVEMMGGNITVHSRYGEGSEFIFTIIQKHVDDEYAVELKYNEEERDELYIAGEFANEERLDELKNLCRLYKLHFVDYKETDKEIRYFFTDYGTYLKDKEIILDCKIAHGTEVIVLQNPMNETLWDSEVSVINAPLYTVNFVHVLNHEMLSVHEKENETMTFIAPKAKILIVDDNEMNLKVATGLLEPLHMKMDVAQSGKEALELLQAKDYHLVFMDHMMPVMDGIETTAIIRSWGEEDEYFKKLPIIALSANAITGAREEFLAKGMDGFVSKPIELRSILKVLKEFLPADLIEETNAPLVDHQDDFADVEPISGLDVVSGVKNSGSRELFYSLLGDFYKLIDTKSTKIYKCLEDHLIKDYTIEVHALKNTARMIGAMELSQNFLDLENHGREEDIEYLENNTEKVLEFYRSYKEILRPYGEIQYASKEEVSNTELLEILMMMKEAVDSFDLDTVDAGMKRLEEVKLPMELEEGMNELRAAVADVAMEDILSITSKMMAKI